MRRGVDVECAHNISRLLLESFQLVFSFLLPKEDISLTKSVSNLSEKRQGDILLVDCFHELSDDEWNALDALDLLLRPDELALQAPATFSMLTIARSKGRRPTFAHL